MVGGRHHLGLVAIMDRLKVLLYAELRSRVAPCHRYYGILFMLDKTGYSDVRTVLYLLLLILYWH